MNRPAVVATCLQLNEVDGLAEDADIAELRLDHLDATMADINRCDSQVPLLLTDRIGSLDTQEQRRRIESVTEIIQERPIWGIDIDHGLLTAGDGTEVSSAVESLVEIAANTDTVTICSMHPDRTPSRTTMIDQLTQAGTVGDIAKLAVPTKTPSELEALVRTTATLADEIPIATMATGEYGLVSRVICAGLGSQLVYGRPTTGTPVIEGQPSLETLRSVIDPLR